MNESLHKYLCWLDQIKGIGRRTRLRLARTAGEGDLFSGGLDAEEAAEAEGRGPASASEAAAAGARRLYRAPENQLRFWCAQACFGPADAGRTVQLLRAAGKQEPARIEEDLACAGIRFSCILEEAYPDRLRSVPDPPFGIYSRGEIPFLEGEEPSAAVIGARLASGYGREQARRFAYRMASGGITIISGMARGIDGIAQRAALDGGGKSYAVLGCGVDQCYPEENRDLYDRLLREGGVLSEFPPGTPPDSKNFPQRNRIISGLSDMVLVIEARRRSGTLITVDMALEQGRDVFALPGRVSDSLSDGCNRLIRQGAGAATCPEDILEYFFGIGDGPEWEKGRRRGYGWDLSELPAPEAAEEEKERGDCYGREESSVEEEGDEGRGTVSAAETDPGGGPGKGGKTRGEGKEAGPGAGPARAGGPRAEEAPVYGGEQKKTAGPAGGDRQAGSGRFGKQCHDWEIRQEAEDPQPCGGGRARGFPQAEQVPFRWKKAESPLEAALLNSLSTEEELHLDRILENVNALLNETGEEPVSISSLIPALMRLKIEGRAEETAPGYYRRRGRWG